jgi:ADP-ribose pyrophosphatase YjhB (NUDIX family)
LVTDDDNRVLLLRRADDGTWCMPGGAAEPGSSFATTALTELAEESGLVAHENDLVPFASISEPDVHVLTYPNGDVTHCFAMYFAVRQ